MKTNTKMIAAKNSMNKFVKNEKGATLVEYALVLFAILILVAGAFKKLGGATSAGATKATAELK